MATGFSNGNEGVFRLLFSEESKGFWSLTLSNHFGLGGVIPLAGGDIGWSWGYGGTFCCFLWLFCER